MMDKPEMDENYIPAKYKNISSQVLELLHYEVMFTLQQRRQGAVVIHFLICLYAFAALAILCDDYFCAALNKICKRLDIHPDVAGATFMAAGSSMPTMFISVTSVFLDEGDIGLGTIIGSTMFNILFITGVCGIATTAVILLKPYSIIRDCSFYVLYLIVLLAAMHDGMIHWYEAAIVSSLYVFYVVLMFHNTQLEHRFNVWARAHFKQSRHVFDSPVKRSPAKPPFISHQSPINEGTKSPLRGEPSEVPSSTQKGSPTKPPAEPPLEHKNITAPSQSNSPTQLLTEPSNDPPTELATETTNELPSLTTESPSQSPCNPHTHHTTGPTTSTPVKELQYITQYENIPEDDDNLTNTSDVRSVFSDADASLPHTKYDEEPDDALTCPPGRWQKVRWVIMFPIQLLYYVTIPDCRRESWENWYLVTFLMSIAWMGAHSYVLVWAVSVIGATIGIPECIMGLTLLAAGSSVPDAIASLVMTRQRMGDMALANAIGSNIFDMLCLSVPWLFSTTVVHPNSIVMINGGNIMYVSLTLFGTVFVTLVILHYNKWQLDKRLGFAMLITYFFFLVTAVVIESYPQKKNINRPLHRPDLPNKGLGVPHHSKHKVAKTGFWT